MSSNYHISNISKVNNFFYDRGIEKIDEEIVTTKRIVSILKERNGELDKLILEFIKYILNKEIPKFENDQLYMTYLIANANKIKKTTGLKTPMIVPIGKSAYILIAVLVIVYTSLFYLISTNLYFSLPFLLFFVNLSIGLIIGLFIWKGILSIFPNSIGKKRFAGVKSIRDLFDELYKINLEYFVKNDYAQTQKMLKSISEIPSPPKK